MEIDKILKYLKYEDLPEDLQAIADESGMDVVTALLKTWEGQRISITRVTKMEDLMIRYLTDRTCNCKNSKKLAKEIGMSEQHVNKLLKKIYESNN